MSPKVTVLMPVYNGARYLREAIESILNQSFRDFEFLVIDDGSMDKSADIVRSYSDSRIRLVCNEKNLQLIATLNKGLDLARGQYIARMDCDDISLPTRLEKQIEFMDKYPDVGVCGTYFRLIGNVGLRKAMWKCKIPQNNEEINANLFYQSVLAHPTICMRKALLEKYNLRYRADFVHAEDYKLWIECAEKSCLANIPEVLLLYRIHGESISSIHANKQRETTARILFENIIRLGIPHSVAMERLFLGKTDERITADFLELSKLLCEIENANKIKKIYNQEYFLNTLNALWFDMLYKNSYGIDALRAFIADRKRWNANLSWLTISKFIMKCILNTAKNIRYL